MCFAAMYLKLKVSFGGKCSILPEFVLSKCSSTGTVLSVLRTMNHDVWGRLGEIFTVRDLAGQGGAIDPRQPSPLSPRRGHP